MGDVKNTLLAVGIGAIVGVALLVGMSAVVTNAVLPLSSKIEIMTDNQVRMEKALSEKIAVLEKKLAERPMPVAAAQPQRPPEPQMDLTTVHEIPVAKSYVLGNPNAPVTITEFSDLQCPFCARFHAPLKEVLKAYPDKVKIVFKNFPLGMHPQARPAAKAAMAAGQQGKYFEMVDLILQNQQSLSEEKYKEFATQLGIGVEKFTRDLKDKDAEFEAIINQEMELGSQVGVQGTPTYYLNGRQTIARSLDQWKAEIEKLLAEKK